MGLQVPSLPRSISVASLAGLTLGLAWILCAPALGQTSASLAHLEQRCRQVEQLAGRYVAEAPLWSRPQDLVLYRGERDIERVRLGFPRRVRAVMPLDRGPLLRDLVTRDIAWHVAYEELILTAAYRAWQQGRLQRAEKLLERLETGTGPWDLMRGLLERVRLARAEQWLKNHELDKAIRGAHVVEHGPFPELRRAARRIRAQALALHARQLLKRTRYAEARAALEQAQALAQSEPIVEEVAEALTSRATEALRRAEELLRQHRPRLAWQAFHIARALDPGALELQRLDEKLRLDNPTLVIVLPELPVLRHEPGSVGRYDWLLAELLGLRLRTVEGPFRSQPGPLVADWHQPLRAHRFRIRLRMPLPSAQQAPFTAWSLAREVRRFGQAVGLRCQLSVLSPVELEVATDTEPPQWTLPVWLSASAAPVGPYRELSRSANALRLRGATTQQRTRQFDEVLILAVGDQVAKELAAVGRGEVHLLAAERTTLSAALRRAQNDLVVLEHNAPRVGCFVLNPQRPALRELAARRALRFAAWRARHETLKTYPELRASNALLTMLPEATQGTTSEDPSSPAPALPPAVESLRLCYQQSPYQPHVVEFLQRTAHQLDAWGAAARIVAVPTARWPEVIAKGDYDALYWELDWRGGEALLLAALSGRDVSSHGVPALAVTDETLLALAMQLCTERDPRRKRRLVRAWEELLRAQAVVTPLWMSPEVVVVNARLWEAARRVGVNSSDPAALLRVVHRLRLRADES